MYSDAHQNFEIHVLMLVILHIQNLYNDEMNEKSVICWINIGEVWTNRKTSRVTRSNGWELKDVTLTRQLSSCRFSRVSLKPQFRLQRQERIKIINFASRVLGTDEHCLQIPDISLNIQNWKSVISRLSVTLINGGIYYQPLSLSAIKTIGTDFRILLALNSPPLSHVLNQR